MHDRQAMSDAWWTGPLIAPGATPLPKGRTLIDAYLFDNIREGRFDARGERRDATRTHAFRSLTYVLYGLTDDLTVGIIPVMGYNDAGGSADSSVRLGDVTAQFMYRLTKFREGGWVPATSLVVQQIVPTGRYDELEHPSRGIGAGAYTTNVALRSQSYWWMPNGRILRTRLHGSYAMSSEARVRGLSVYGTARDFWGHAKPGDVLTINAAGEYSVTRNWVLALDLVYQHDESTTVRGRRADPASGMAHLLETRTGSAWRFGVAPGIEYNWNARVGLIIGARWYVAGRNTNATFTPMAALNLVF